MSEFRDVVPGFAVSPQIDAADLSEAVSAGYTLVINNRPDDEIGGGFTSDQAGAVCTAAGLGYVHIPVAGGFSMEDVEATQKALAQATGPVLAYCRSGTRSITLWGLAAAKARSHTPIEITKAARAAGYDLDNFAPTLARLYGPV